MLKSTINPKDLESNSGPKRIGSISSFSSSATPKQRQKKRKEVQASPEYGRNRLKDSTEATFGDTQGISYEKFFGLLFDRMEVGKSLIVRKLPNDYMRISIYTPKAIMDDIEYDKDLPDEYWLEVVSPEYWDFYDRWSLLLQDEKEKYAKRVKATWKIHEKLNVNNMRMFRAVLKKEGISKYKPEYSTRDDRKKLQVVYLRGLF